MKDIIINALKEDIGRKDITTDIFIPPKIRVNAVIIAKEDCVACGLSLACSVFKLLDKNIKFKFKACDGSFVKKGAILARISGQARTILTGERVALNFLSLLCGIATTTRQFVQRVRPYKTKILDTRKTIPGLRLLEKYAVRIGGGFNHRMSLDDMVLIKDNHLKIINGYDKLLSLRGLRAKGEAGRSNLIKKFKIELEVKSLKEFKDALKLKPDIIMLDNMNYADIKKAVLMKRSAKHLPLLEASGGITLKNVKKIASTGVEAISVGALTHSVNSIDISLEIE